MKKFPGQLFRLENHTLLADVRVTMVIQKVQTVTNKHSTA
jgi:hypothetical protein